MPRSRARWATDRAMKSRFCHIETGRDGQTLRIARAASWSAG